jgi:NAD kinase
MTSEIETDVNKMHYVLNEVMTSEKDPSILSIYRLNVDGKDLGKFRSSGIIIATGTGSTGWLYSAR